MKNSIFVKINKEIFDFLVEKQIFESKVRGVDGSVNDSFIFSENKIYELKPNSGFCICFDSNKKEVVSNLEDLKLWFIETNKKHYLGIDPGKQGAFVIIDENSNIVEKIGTPLIGKDYDKQGIIDILKSREFHKIGLENPSVIFGIGKSAVASLSNCVGLLEGMMLGLELPYILIQPKEWQKECWKHVKVQKKSDGKTNDTKATSIIAAVNLWSKEDFKVTNKGGKSVNHNEGMIDAVLIAEYTRRLFK